MLFYLKAAVLILILTTFVSLAATKSFQPAKDKNNFDKGRRKRDRLNKSNESDKDVTLHESVQMPKLLRYLHSKDILKITNNRTFTQKSNSTSVSMESPSRKKPNITRNERKKISSKSLKIEKIKIASHSKQRSFNNKNRRKYHKPRKQIITHEKKGKTVSKSNFRLLKRQYNIRNRGRQISWSERNQNASKGKTEEKLPHKKNVQAVNADVKSRKSEDADDNREEGTSGSDENSVESGTLITNGPSVKSKLLEYHNGNRDEGRPGTGERENILKGDTVEILPHLTSGYYSIGPKIVRYSNINIPGLVEKLIKGKKERPVELYSDHDTYTSDADTRRSRLPNEDAYPEGRRKDVIPTPAEMRNVHDIPGNKKSDMYFSNLPVGDDPDGYGNIFNAVQNLDKSEANLFDSLMAHDTNDEVVKQDLNSEFISLAGMPGDIDIFSDKQGRVYEDENRKEQEEGRIDPSEIVANEERLLGMVQKVMKKQKELENAKKAAEHEAEKEQLMELMVPEGIGKEATQENGKFNHKGERIHQENGRSNGGVEVSAVAADGKALKEEENLNKQIQKGITKIIQKQKQNQKDTKLKNPPKPSVASSAKYPLSLSELKHVKKPTKPYMVSNKEYNAWIDRHNKQANNPTLPFTESSTKYASWLDKYGKRNPIHIPLSNKEQLKPVYTEQGAFMNRYDQADPASSLLAWAKELGNARQAHGIAESQLLKVSKNYENEKINEQNRPYLQNEVRANADIKTNRLNWNKNGQDRPYQTNLEHNQKAYEPFEEAVGFRKTRPAAVYFNGLAYDKPLHRYGAEIIENHISGPELVENKMNGESLTRPDSNSLGYAMLFSKHPVSGRYLPRGTFQDALFEKDRLMGIPTENSYFKGHPMLSDRYEVIDGKQRGVLKDYAMIQSYKERPNWNAPQYPEDVNAVKKQFSPENTNISKEQQKVSYTKEGRADENGSATKESTHPQTPQTIKPDNAVAPANPAKPTQAAPTGQGEQIQNSKPNGQQAGAANQQGQKMLTPFPWYKVKPPGPTLAPGDWRIRDYYLTAENASQWQSGQAAYTTQDGHQFVFNNLISYNPNYDPRKPTKPMIHVVFGTPMPTLQTITPPRDMQTIPPPKVMTGFPMQWYQEGRRKPTKSRYRGRFTGTVNPWLLKDTTTPSPQRLNAPSPTKAPNVEKKPLVNGTVSSFGSQAWKDKTLPYESLLKPEMAINETKSVQILENTKTSNSSEGDKVKTGNNNGNNVNNNSNGSSSDKDKGKNGNNSSSQTNSSSANKSDNNKGIQADSTEFDEENNIQKEHDDALKETEEAKAVLANNGDDKMLQSLNVTSNNAHDKKVASDNNNSKGNLVNVGPTEFLTPSDMSKVKTEEDQDASIAELSKTDDRASPTQAPKELPVLQTPTTKSVQSFLPGIKAPTKRPNPLSAKKDSGAANWAQRYYNLNKNYYDYNTNHPYLNLEALNEGSQIGSKTKVQSQDKIEDHANRQVAAEADTWNLKTSYSPEETTERNNNQQPGNNQASFSPDGQSNEQYSASPVATETGDVRSLETVTGSNTSGNNSSSNVSNTNSSNGSTDVPFYTSQLVLTAPVIAVGNQNSLSSYNSSIVNNRNQESDFKSIATTPQTTTTATPATVTKSEEYYPDKHIRFPTPRPLFKPNMDSSKEKPSGADTKTTQPLVAQNANQFAAPFVDTTTQSMNPNLAPQDTTPSSINQFAMWTSPSQIAALTTAAQNVFLNRLTPVNIVTQDTNPILATQNANAFVGIGNGIQNTDRSAGMSMPLQDSDKVIAATVKVSKAQPMPTVAVDKSFSRKPSSADRSGVTKSTGSSYLSNLRDELNLDDMYWTDSMEEKENICKEDKGTNEVVHVMCFGDSLTRGYYNKGKNHHPYTNKLQLLLNRLDTRKCIIVDNQGKDGELAFEEMPKRLQDIYENSKTKYDWVVILGGTNDIYNKKKKKHHTTQEIIHNILDLHEIAHQYGSKTVAVTVPEVWCETQDSCQDAKQVREQVNSKIRAYAYENPHNVILSDLSETLKRDLVEQKLVAQFFEGGLHLKPRGYERMANIIFQDFKRALS